MVSATGSKPQQRAVRTASESPSFQRPLSLCTSEWYVLHVAAVDVQILADCETGTRAGEEGYGVGDVFRLAEPPDDARLLRGGERLREPCLHPIPRPVLEVDRPGRYGVHTNALLRQVFADHRGI